MSIRELAPFTTVLEKRAGGSYIGCVVPMEAVAPLYKAWVQHLPGEWRELHDARAQRDRGNSLHVTVIAPGEMKRIYNSDELLGRAVTFEPVGVGQVKRGEQETWFIVLRGEAVNGLRGELGLPAHDFHATLGFRPKDIHGVAKDASTIVIA